MKLTFSIILATQLLGVLAAPASFGAPGSVRAVSVRSPSSRSGNASSDSADNAGDSGEGEAAAENEVEQQGQFNTPIQTSGGNIKTDTLFPPGQNGVLEVEFQSQDARTLTVVENTTPGRAPFGFVALEPVSYKITVDGGNAGVTLQKVDYIQNAGSTLDISKGQVGRFCAESNSFVIGEGELEFEADEKELTLTVENVNGEWAIFLPDPNAAASGEAATAPNNNATVGVNAGALQSFMNQLIQLLTRGRV